jgi:hypothetical protein
MFMERSVVWMQYRRIRAVDPRQLVAESSALAA